MCYICVMNYLKIESLKRGGFYHVTFAFRRADFYNEIPSISSQEENPSPQRSGSLVFLYYLLISFGIFLFHARENYAASIKRDDVLLFS